MVQQQQRRQQLPSPPPSSGMGNRAGERPSFCSSPDLLLCHRGPCCQGTQPPPPLGPKSPQYPHLQLHDPTHCPIRGESRILPSPPPFSTATPTPLRQSTREKVSQKKNPKTPFLGTNAPYLCGRTPGAAAASPAAQPCLHLPGRYCHRVGRARKHQLQQLRENTENS